MDQQGNFGGGFDDIWRATKEFGEFFRDMASESGFCGGAWDRDRGQWDKGRKPGEAWKEAFSPRTNIYTREDASLVFEFLVPGFDEKSISVAFAGDMMTLKARLATGDADTGERRYERRQFTLRDIARREYPVPAESYQQDLAKAVYRNGLLRVTIPARAEGPHGQEIKIDIETD